MKYPAVFLGGYSSSTNAKGKRKYQQKGFSGRRGNNKIHLRIALLHKHYSPLRQSQHIHYCAASSLQRPRQVKYLLYHMLSFSHFPSISSILPLSLPLYSNTINRAANLFYSTRRREAALTELRGKSEMLPSSEANNRLFTAVCATFAFISIFLVRRRFEFHRLRSKDFIWRVFWHIKSFWNGHDKHDDAAQYKNICQPKRCRCVCKSWLMPTNQHSHTWQTCSFF